MAWLELRVTTSRGELSSLSARLFQAGAQGLQEDYLPGTQPPPRQPWDVGPPAPEPEERLVRAWFEDPDCSRVEASLAPLEVQWAEVEDEDWETSWQRAHEPVRVSPRLLITPPWCAEPGALVLEPGQGFGTGSHPTTRQALGALDRLLEPGMSVYDAGCGSGILAIAAARLGAGSVVGVDVEVGALREARRNARVNEVEVDLRVGDLASVHGVFDLVLANLYAEVLVAHAEVLAARTGRWLVVAGVLDAKESQVREALSPHLDLVHREQDGEWVSQVWARP